ncbi:MAG: transcription repressor NadR [Eubacteriales bacterium]|nr:transcription repressor NadR [Eubacteriales bacterium]
MEGSLRRQKILEMLEQGEAPVSGAALAGIFGVSRQVIVQDIALLRATDKNILSTNKGYVVYGKKKPGRCRRILPVKHTDEQMQDELYTIVDAGAEVLDVVVEHDVYGQIAVDLMISSRRDVDEFIHKIFANPAKPLKELTGDAHYHTIEAGSEAALDEVEKNLKEKGYLIDFEGRM